MSVLPAITDVESVAQENSATAPTSSKWLFSAPVDLAAFLGSALLSLVLLAVGARLGILHSDSPDWTWIIAVMLVDVAHVHATAFRVYFDPEELRRRPLLYAAVPLAGYLLGVALYSQGMLTFWRTLAYVAVFHFVRQQYGWVALYRNRCGERDRVGWWIDATAVYAATLYPLLYWHTHLPRRFWWFLKDDFHEVPAAVLRIAFPIYVLALSLYAVRTIYRALVQRQWNPGKDIVVVTTAVCWYIGIVSFNSDYAFTVTNVIIHGIPYFVLVYWYRFQRAGEVETAAGHIPRIVGFISVLWLLAFAEELFWERGIWQERSWLFGEPWDWGSAKLWLVPLLALPQITHYILDGFIWRRRSNPGLVSLEQPRLEG